MSDIVVQISEAGERLDTFLSGKTGISRSQIQLNISKDYVLVNNIPVVPHYRIKTGDSITSTIPQKLLIGLIPESLLIEIVYEDDFLIIANKPPDMVVYPAAGHSQGTLMNALAYHCQKSGKKLASIGGPLRPGIVHRLDKDTSGVMVIALDDGAYYKLVEQFRQRTINRKYVVLVYGGLKEAAGEIALPIGRSESDRKKMSTRTRKGKEAITNWRTLKRFDNSTLIEARLGTGRTHQIRVHLASIGHPVMGDITYGKKTGFENNKKKVIIPRQMLHAETLGFIHPVTGEYMEFSRPMPEDMQKVLSELAWK